MTAIITLAQAKYHLRIDGTDEDTELPSMIASAESAVLNYLKIGDVAALAVGSPPEVPANATNAILAAVLLMLGYLYRLRDVDSDKEYQQGYLPRPVTALLYPLRDPSCA